MTVPTFEERDLPSRNRTILVVEDNELNREMLCVLLEDDYNVVQAADGQQGAEIMQRMHEEISLVLLDVYMPVMDGFEFLRFRQSDERFSNVPVIVVTVSESAEVELKCLQLGANDFVVKPYNPEIILNRVSNTIRLRESASIVNQLRWDPITSLYREDFFYRRVDNLLAAYPNRDFDVVCSDIRNFKTLNERYGRENGDRLLHDLASKLVAGIPGVVASGRIAGDSFAFLMESAGHDWTECLNEIVRNMEVPHLYMRFGIVEAVDHELGASQLCDRATTALEELRDSVGADVMYHDDALRQRKVMERALVESMHEGIADEQFIVYYQPKHNVRTGKVVGAEALVRWPHPELGFVRPDVFITLFERNGMIRELDEYVCEQTCREIAFLQEQGLNSVPISVNISPLDFDDPQLPKRILRIADKYGIPHSLLHIELTETAYAEDPDDVIAALRELKSYGFKIELDDFGSGYSSLALLNVLPLDIIKIDGSLVRNASRLDDFRLIQSAIQIAQLLGMETVIEGVETSAAIDRLRQIGCDLIQGFYYSLPLREEDFEKYPREQ